MKTSKEVRRAVKEVYESQSVSFSDCYELEGLKKIRVIFLPSDAPRYVSEIAEFLRNKVKKKYPEINPEIITITPLFSKEADHKIMACEALKNAAEHLTKLPQVHGEESVILCPSDMVHEILFKKRFAIQQFNEDKIPALLCDTDSFMSSRGAFEKAALKINVSPEIFLAYELYHKKVPTPADVLVVLASGYECWNVLIDFWHRIANKYKKQAKILYIDDLEQWTSKEYANKIFAKFTWLLKKSNISNTALRMPPYVFSIADILASQNTIFCIPQEKSSWIYDMRQAMTSSTISFYIIPQEFCDIWTARGPIGKQFFCQEMKRLEESSQSPNKLNSYNFNTRFSDWNLRLYWWNYKACLNNYCWISFLSY